MTKRSSHICRLTLNSAFILNMAEETLSYESQGISLIINNNRIRNRLSSMQVFTLKGRVQAKINILSLFSDPHIYEYFMMLGKIKQSTELNTDPRSFHRVSDDGESSSIKISKIKPHFYCSLNISHH